MKATKSGSDQAAFVDYLEMRIKELWDNQSERKVLEDTLKWVLARNKGKKV